MPTPLAIYRKTADGEYLIPDDFLIDIATTCSDRGIALQSEIILRKRYPSKKRILKRTSKEKTK